MCMCVCPRKVSLVVYSSYVSCVRISVQTQIKGDPTFLLGVHVVPIDGRIAVKSCVPNSICEGKLQVISMFAWRRFYCICQQLHAQNISLWTFYENADDQSHKNFKITDDRKSRRKTVQISSVAVHNLMRFIWSLWWSKTCDHFDTLQKNIRFKRLQMRVAPWYYNKNIHIRPCKSAASRCIIWWDSYALSEDLNHVITLAILETQCNLKINNAGSPMISSTASTENLANQSCRCVTRVLVSRAPSCGYDIDVHHVESIGNWCWVRSRVCVCVRKQVCVCVWSYMCVFSLCLALAWSSEKKKIFSMRQSKETYI